MRLHSATNELYSACLAVSALVQVQPTAQMRRRRSTKKGDDSEDRPHRYSRVVEIPATLTVVPTGLLEAVASDLDAELERKRARSEVDRTRPVEPEALGDDALLDRARNARNGSKFRSLYDLGDYTGYPSASEADCALFVLLAYWTGEDPARMDALFLGSALAKRDKTERPDYRERTITAAIKLNNGAAPSPSRSKAAPRPRPSPAPDLVPPTAVDAPRPKIEINTERHRILAEVLAALPLDTGLYVRGGSLVRVVHETHDAVKLSGGVSVRNALGMVRVAMLSEAGLACRLPAIVEFFS